MHTLIIGSAAALARLLFVGPILTQPAFAEAPNSVNVGGNTMSRGPGCPLRFQLRRDSEARVTDCRQRPNCCCCGPRDVCFGC